MFLIIELIYFILLIVLHLLIDFDLQFMIIFLILVITLNLWDGKQYELFGRYAGSVAPGLLLQPLKVYLLPIGATADPS